MDYRFFGAGTLLIPVCLLLGPLGSVLLNELMRVATHLSAQDSRLFLQPSLAHLRFFEVCGSQPAREEVVSFSPDGSVTNQPAFVQMGFPGCETFWAKISNLAPLRKGILKWVECGGGGEQRRGPLPSVSKTVSFALRVFEGFPSICDYSTPLSPVEVHFTFFHVRCHQWTLFLPEFSVIS